MSDYKIGALNENDVWYLSATGSIHHWVGNSWTKVDGSAVDLAVGGGDVYVINGEGTLYKWENAKWAADTVANNVKNVSVTPDGTCWVVNKDGKVLHKPKNGHWDASEVNSARGAGPSANAMPPAHKIHFVKEGEWLTKIAEMHSTTVAKLVELNVAKYPSLNVKVDAKQTVQPGWELIYG